ncbi:MULTISPECIES: Rv0361 family membrane protein [unclassified Modestobacter]
MTTGPFLYDDDPAPLHTGTPRRRTGFLLAMLIGTVLVAVAMAATIGVFKGSAEEQATEVATVFIRALDAGDLPTAYDLVCDDVRARVLAPDLAETYLRPGTPEVTSTTGDVVDGVPVQRVDVRWDDDGAVARTQLTVVPEGGTKVCGTRALD